MNDKDLPLQVNDVVVVERPVRVENECLNLSCIFIVPELALVNGPPTVEEDKAAHMSVRLELPQLL